MALTNKRMQLEKAMGVQVLFHGLSARLSVVRYICSYLSYTESLTGLTLSQFTVRQRILVRSPLFSSCVMMLIISSVGNTPKSFCPFRYSG